MSSMEKEDWGCFHIEKKKNRKSNKKFRNVGVEKWELARKAWRTRTVPESRSSIPLRLSRSSRVKKGLSKVSRNYQLPDRMKLSAVIAIYSELWEDDSSKRHE